MLGRRSDAHRLGAVAAKVEQPQVEPAAIGRQVGLAQLVDDPVAVGGHRRRAEAAQGGEVGGGDRAGGNGRGRGKSERGEARGEELSHGTGD